MARLFVALCLTFLAYGAHAGGYGEPDPPPPPPTPPPYEPTEPPPPPPPPPKPEPSYDPPPAPEPIPDPPMPDPPAPEPYIPEPMPDPPMPDPPMPPPPGPSPGYNDVEPEPPIPDPPMPEPDGYRRRRFRQKKTRRFRLKTANEADLGLQLIPGCLDFNAAKCKKLAEPRIARNKVNGRLVTMDPCKNPQMRKINVCARTCDVCTPNIQEFKLRRRNALRLRKLRLSKTRTRN